MLGYENFDSFERGCINKAIGACTTLQITVLENFQQVQREIDGRIVNDFKLSRFACYLVAMNGDVKKPAVATAQAYFASMAEVVRKYIEKGENVERVLIRDDVSDRERSLSGVAYAAGVEQYGLFQNSGYRACITWTFQTSSVLKECRETGQHSTLWEKKSLQPISSGLPRLRLRFATRGSEAKLP
jgi:DNA-damage-inducible protein D